MTTVERNQSTKDHDNTLNSLINGFAIKPGKPKRKFSISISKRIDQYLDEVGVKNADFHDAWEWLHKNYPDDYISSSVSCLFYKQRKLMEKGSDRVQRAPVQNVVSRHLAVKDIMHKLVSTCKQIKSCLLGKQVDNVFDLADLVGNIKTISDNAGGFDCFLEAVDLLVSLQDPPDEDEQCQDTR